QRQQRRLAAAARSFQLPSETHGFQYIHVPSRARQPAGQIRANLRRFGIGNSRVLDIQYPARQLVGILVHNDYAPTVKEKLQSINIKTTTFDPLDPKNIHDPKYKDESRDTKAQIALELQYQRALRSLQYIREPVKYAVARAFHDCGWIATEDLKEILAKRR
ncbi:hypothetical protein BDB00DRAFT_734334, partial [Zychaea mexicana]|uniref:uncharacterized protein n=1 Tax=Zychaea mexicana TaxID=64656 RepID=UPI0022FF313F